MPSAVAGGLQNGASPITSGDGAATGGVVQIMDDGAGVPGLLELYDASGVTYYLNVGSSGVVRAGLNDPSSDPDVNASIALIAGGLSVDGANWMTGRLMSTDLRITSRANILTSINDSFGDSSIDPTLWTEVGSPVEGTYLEISGSGVSSVYQLDGDFDIRLSIRFYSSPGGPGASTPHGGLCFTFSPAADASPLDQLGNDRVFLGWGGRHYLDKMTVEGRASGTAFAAETTSGLDQDRTEDYGAIRLVREGNTFTAYYKNNDAIALNIENETNWIQFGASRTFTPTRSNAVLHVACNSVSSVWHVHALYAKSATPFNSSGNSGPAWKMDSIATLDAGEDWLKIYNGPSTTAANEIAKITSDAEFVAGLLGTNQGALVAGSAGAEAPGLLELYEDDDSTLQYLWLDGGVLRVSSSKPTTAATDGEPVWAVNAVSGWAASGYTGTRTLDGTESTVQDVINILGQLIDDLKTGHNLKA